MMSPCASSSLARRTCLAPVLRFRASSSPRSSTSFGCSASISCRSRAASLPAGVEVSVHLRPVTEVVGGSQRTRRPVGDVGGRRDDPPLGLRPLLNSRITMTGTLKSPTRMTPCSSVRRGRDRFAGSGHRRFLHRRKGEKGPQAFHGKVSGARSSLAPNIPAVLTNHHPPAKQCAGRFRVDDLALHPLSPATLTAPAAPRRRLTSQPLDYATLCDIWPLYRHGRCYTPRWTAIRNFYVIFN